MLTLLNFFVIPLLEYSRQLWNPWKVKDMQAIEAIHRTFTFKITEVQHLIKLLRKTARTQQRSTALKQLGMEILHELKFYSL